MKKLMTAISFVPALLLTLSAAQAADPVSSNVALYKSTTWTNSVFYFVVRQGAHATINYCTKGATFTGNASDTTQLANFMATSCPKSWVTSSYSNPTGTGFVTKTYLAGTGGALGSVILTASYSQSSDGLVNTQAGFQTFAFDLDPGANPATSVIMEQGASISYQGSDNPTLNSYKQTFTFQGAMTMDYPPIVD